MEREKKLVSALGSLASMAIDNTKGSEAVKVCYNEALNCVLSYENEIQNLKEEIQRLTPVVDMCIQKEQKILTLTQALKGSDNNV